jgi:hypothetical protein
MTPKAAVERADIAIPGHGDKRDNRLVGLGPLSGTGVGVVVRGAAASCSAHCANAG